MRFNLNRMGAVVSLDLRRHGAAEKPRPRRFERMKTLPQWKGTVEWSGARTGSGDGGRISFRQRTALVETLGVDELPMTSVYHMDGGPADDAFLRTQNQPRLWRLASTRRGGGTFSFVDATNLKTPTSPHVPVRARFLKRIGSGSRSPSPATRGRATSA
jgi:hypothetical protein